MSLLRWYMIQFNFPELVTWNCESKWHYILAVLPEAEPFHEAARDSKQIELVDDSKDLT